MAYSCNIFCLCSLLVLAALAAGAASSPLTPYFYDKICPQALPTIKQIVQNAIYKEPRMGASLIRLHFHDCFVNGCDASNLLDPTPTIDSEKFSLANNNSARGFEVIDQIKWAVDKACGYPVVSCADILAVAARDSSVALGGPSWEVRLGRRDSTTASRTQANADLPNPLMDLPALISNFQAQGLNERDLVALSGAHTLGLAQCFTFRNRIYNETDIDPQFAKQRRANCPLNGGNSNLAPLDQTPAKFDLAYFINLKNNRGLLHSDQALFNGGSTDGIVASYTSNPQAFWTDFANSMIKMGNIKPIFGQQGQVRCNCRRVNN